MGGVVLKGVCLVSNSSIQQETTINMVKIIHLLFVLVVVLAFVAHGKCPSLSLSPSFMITYCMLAMDTSSESSMSLNFELKAGMSLFSSSFPLRLPISLLTLVSLHFYSPLFEFISLTSYLVVNDTVCYGCPIPGCMPLCCPAPPYYHCCRSSSGACSCC